MQNFSKDIAQVIRIVDGTLYTHLEGLSEVDIIIQGWGTIFFNLTVRDIPLVHTIRLWDTYLSHGSSFDMDYHMYVATSLVLCCSQQLQTCDDYSFAIKCLKKLSKRSKTWDDSNAQRLIQQADHIKDAFAKHTQQINDEVQSFQLTPTVTELMEEIDAEVDCFTLMDVTDEHDDDDLLQFVLLANNNQLIAETEDEIDDFVVLP
eukprot:TRINITY_DN5803_c0_g1_i1.p2 TRINITY_DN5803_c0_g1~~TRINITY_DN5803_c0_g1_i1.p2  ORF type:complete len:205 (-),score=45.77 TRINITY_DN5803_c0_g1_i1:109-723(-)